MEEKQRENINGVKTPSEVNNTIKNQPTKNNNVLIGILITIIILLMLIVIYMIFFNKPKEEIKDNNQTQNSETNMNNQNKGKEEKTELEGKYELIVYKSIEYGYLCYDDTCKDSNEYQKYATIKAKSENARIISIEDNSNSFVLYDDNGIKIYNLDNRSIDNTNLQNIYKSYTMYLNENKDKVIGIVFFDGNQLGYYNVVKNKKMYTNKYYSDSTSGLEQINSYYLSLTATKDGKAYLLSCNEEKEILSSPKNTESDLYFYDAIGTKDNYFIVLKSWHYEDSSIVKIYDNNLKEFYSKSINSENYTFANDSIYIIEDKKVVKYNTEGNLVFTSNNYEDIKSIILNYIVYVKDNNLILENIDDSNETKVLTKWNKDLDIHFISGYYTRDELDSMNESNKKEGLYVVVEYPGMDSSGNYGMEYCYTPDKQIIEYPIKDMLGGRAKPVLYLYPEEETNIKVSFAHPEYLTTTYPKYTNSWNVTVKPNGNMKDQDGKYYYALYWDEKRYNEVDFTEGFYVEAKDAISFLEEKLSIIGLSDKERNEFIMYWLPIMENNKKNLVYFELTKERELGNKLIIEPKPDSLLRVSIHIKKVNKKVNITEQKLETFNRSGFTAVEWGGMTY